MTIRTKAGRTPFLLALLMLFPLTSAAQETGGSDLLVTLEATRPFVYAGDPVIVRIGVFNTGDKPYDNKVPMDLVGGLQVVDADTAPVKTTKKDKPGDKEQPVVLAAGGFFGQFHDMTKTVAGVGKAGAYTITLRVNGMTAGPVTVKVLPPFDPDANYVAVFETDYGALEFNLLTKLAPGHVQSFYDLAMRGFYDNTVLFEVIKGVELRGGDPTGSGDGWPGYALDPEVTDSHKHTRGTLSAVRLPNRSRDNGSQFVITLGPNPRYDGVLSVFGQLAKGEETLTAIENIPTTGQIEPPFYHPLKPLSFRSVTVKKASGK